jgi:quercetin dioxygenase-like cupin family protein
MMMEIVNGCRIVKSYFIASLTLACVMITPCAAQTAFTSTPVLKTTTTAAGSPIVYPRTDSAEVSAVVVDMQPGADSGPHLHPVPAFIYMLSGAIEVKTEGAETHAYKSGDALVEAVNAWHSVKNTGTGHARFLVVFTGVRDHPNSRRPQ